MTVFQEGQAVQVTHAQATCQLKPVHMLHLLQPLGTCGHMPHGTVGRFHCVIQRPADLVFVSICHPNHHLFTSDMIICRPSRMPPLLLRRLAAT